MLRRTSARSFSGIEKVDVDRFDLRDGDDRSVGVGFNQVAGMGLEAAGAAGHGCDNPGEIKIELRAGDGGAIGGNGGGGTGGSRMTLIVLLARADALLPQGGITLLVEGSLMSGGLIAGHVGFSLVEIGLERCAGRGCKATGRA